jgi:epoxyqueuosine reductase
MRCEGDYSNAALCGKQDCAAYNAFMPIATPHALSATIKALAREAGFDLAGIARAEASSRPEAYARWIDEGQQGSMHYLAERIDERVDITKKFPWAKSIVCVGLAYYQEMPDSPDESAGKIARYAWGRDYHKVIKGKLRAMERRLREALGAEGEALVTRSYSDTGPILEREFAARAGLGWVGKNTLLIHPQKGSWFLLGEMVLSVELEPDGPIGDHCGTCRRCIEACPTEAITPYQVNGAKCISYLTIEHRGEIEAGFHGPMREAGYVIGCDICQEVCPFNRRPLQTSEADFAVRMPAPAVGLSEILRWQEAEWDALTRGRAFRRAKVGMWQRNAAIVQGKMP